MSPAASILRGALLAVTLLVLWPVAALGARDCTGDPEGFRSDLEAYAASRLLLAETLGRAGAPGAAALESPTRQLDQLIRELTPEDLARLCSMFPRDQALPAFPPLPIDAMALDSGGGICSRLILDQGAFDDALAALLIEKLLAESLQLACDLCSWAIFGDLCRSFFCVFASVAHVAVLVTQNTVDIGGNYCPFGDHDTVATREFKELVGRAGQRISLKGIEREFSQAVTPLDRRLSSVASQHSVQGLEAEVGSGGVILGGSLEDTLAELAAQAIEQERFREQSLGERIEANLQPGEVGRISSFQLPEAFGGLLEIVRRVVADTIDSREQAGHDVSQALGHFDHGDNAFNGRRYKAAFGHYRSAYRSAVSTALPNQAPHRGGRPTTGHKGP